MQRRDSAASRGSRTSRASRLSRLSRPRSPAASSTVSFRRSQLRKARDMVKEADAADEKAAEETRKKRSRRRTLVTLLVGCTASAAGACACAILFLVPFTIDPAISALRSEITRSSGGCRVSQAHVGVGLSQCNWTSCLEGCTRELFKCYQVKVRVDDEDWRERIWNLKRQRQLAVEEEGLDDEYSAEIISAYDDDDLSAVFRVNTRGCGYPPVVSCEGFFQEYGIENQTFPCFYSKQDPEVAIPHFDEASEKRKLWLSGIPFVLLVVMLAIMCLGMKIQKRMEKDDDEDSLLGDDADDMSLGSDATPRETPPPSSRGSVSGGQAPLPPLPSPNHKSNFMADLAQQMQQVTKRRTLRKEQEQVPTLSKRIRH